VELSVREDGTSFPAFVYGHGSLGDNETRVEGKPFYLDMTFGSTQAIGETYLGFDFGTSNSSFCFVEASDVKIYESRAHDKNWLELNDLISVVPYPMAATLAAYMAETSKDRMDTLGREAVEAALGLFAYIAYSEYCSMRGKHSSHIFKGMQHRSTGPLWNMLKQTLAEGAGKALFCREMSRMLRNPWFGELDHVVSNIAQSKHGKTSEIDYPRILALVGNLANAVFSTCLFGYFEDVKRKPFRSSFCGTFRNARGPARPFVDMYEYEGRDGFSPEMVFLCHAESGQALPLSPLLLWGLNVSGSRYEEPDLYLYDRSSDKDKMFGYKSVQPREELRIECQDDFGPLFAQLQEMKSEDPRVHLIEGISLRHTRSAAGYVQSG
jgi:hypothetical protein